MPTIYDVARLAKVSTTTVSKVLSNTPYVSEKTRQRILAAMRELQYSPNLAARGLTNNHTYVLGLIIPYDPDYLFSDPFVLEVIHGVESVASENDYNVLLSMSKKSDQRSAADRFLRSGYVDGVVMVETVAGGSASKDLEACHIPYVSVGYREDRQEINSVHSNHYQGAYKAVKHLLSLGHRRIGVISGPTNFIMGVEERIRGARDAMKQYGLTLDSDLITYGDFTIDSGYRAALPLLEAKERPTAIFAINDRMALGAIRRARELHLHIPADLSLVGFDDVPLMEVIEPPLTTVRQFPVEIGRIATQRLFEIIEHKITEFASVVLPVDLIVRTSTAPPCEI